MRCHHRNALVVVAASDEKRRAIQWCPECGALYYSRYRPKKGWSSKREWQRPGRAAAMAYVALRRSVRAQDWMRKLAKRKL